MSLSIGIVGLPNVGKSTLFTALTKKTGLAANYPFATIDPNVGIVDVPDSRLQKLADIVNPGRIVPATVEFVDIAGLVKGANEGEGLGNQFLANIRETDAICEVAGRFRCHGQLLREQGGGPHLPQRGAGQQRRRGEQGYPDAQRSPSGSGRGWRLR